MKTTVMHHSADFDGIFCREIARKFLPEAEFIGWDFGDQPVPLHGYPADQRFYVLDLPVDRVFGFDYSKSSVQPFFDPRKSNVTWIDHHKSAIESHPKDIPGYRIDGVAACRLAWQWFSTNPGALEYGTGVLPVKGAYIDRRLLNEPLAVRLAGEYDIWDKRDPRAELFQHGLRSRDLEGWWPHLLGEETVKNLSVSELEKYITAGEPVELLPNGTVKVRNLADRIVDNLLRRGEAVQYAKTHENESIIKHIGFDLEWEGLRFLACNHAHYNSFLFTAGLRPEHDACFGFKYNGKGKWEVSLYHAPGKEHHDLSLIAVKYGGGGHRGACGFVCDTLPIPLKCPAASHSQK